MKRALPLASLCLGVLACAPPPAPPAPPPRRAPAAAAPAGRSYASSGGPELVLEVGGGVDLAELSPDGLLLATAGRDERGVRIWDVDRRTVVTELGMMPGPVQSLRWENGGRWLLTVGRQGSVLYDGRTGRALANVPTDACAVLSSPPELVFWSPNDHTLAAVPFDGRGSFAVPLPETPASIHAAGGSKLLLSFDDRTEVRSADLKALASVPAAGTVTASADGAFATIENRIADLATGKIVHAASDFRRGLAWSNHGHALAFGSEKELHLWTGPGAIAPPRRTPEPIAAIAWAPDDRGIAFIDLANRLYLASPEGGAQRPIGSSKNGGALGFSPDGRKITVSFRELAIWDVGRAALEATLPSRECRVDWANARGPRAICPTISASGASLEIYRVGASSPESATPATVDVRESRYAWHDAERAFDAVCADGSAVLVPFDASQVGTIRRDATIRKKILESFKKRVAEVELFTGADAIAGVVDGAVEVWDKASGDKRFRATLPVRAGQASFSGDGALVAVAPSDNSTRVFVLDAKKGAIVRALDQERPVRRAYFHPNAPILLTSRGQPSAGEIDKGDEVRIWDARSGRVLKKLPGSFGAFSPDGSLLSAVEPDAARTFDAKSFFSLATVKGPGMFAFFTADGHGLLTAASQKPGLPASGGAALELHDARNGLLLFRMNEAVREPAVSRDASRIVILPLHGSTDVDSRPAFFADLWERDKQTPTRLVSSLFPLTAPELWDGGKVLATRSRGLLRLDRIAPRRTVWVAARALGPGRCEVAVFDESGTFDGPADDLIAFRRGDDLRESALETGPAIAAHRHPGMLREFFEGR